MSSRERPYRARIVACVAMAILGAAACRGTSGDAGEASGHSPVDRATAEQAYQMQVELLLARSDALYMIIDLPRERLALARGGALLWESSLSAVDSAALDRFESGFMGADDRIIRPLRGVDVYAWAPQTPDSVLEIVSDATGFSADLLQRHMPGRFMLRWDGAALDIHTLVHATESSPLKNVIRDVGRSVREVAGEKRARVEIDSLDAVTLSRAAVPGMPTLLKRR